MLKPWLLKLHRWISIAFALPLAGVILTGLILSFEPIATTAGGKLGALDLARVESILHEHDPKGEARGLSFRSYEGRLTVQGVGPEGSIDVDIATGQEFDDDGFLSSWFGWARGAHETLLLEESWLVIASTAAMLVLIAIGVAMGWMRPRNTISGWHRGMAWFGLPLLIASPLTGLFLAYGISFTPAPGGGPRAQPLPLREAVSLVARDKDLANLVWLRGRGGRQLVRLNEGGEYRVYQVTREGLQPQARNWPRLIHEGNFAGVWSGLMNVAISFAFIGLMVTGLIIWARRKLRRRRRPRAVAQPLPAE